MIHAKARLACLCSENDESGNFLGDVRLSNTATPFLCGYYRSGTYLRMVLSSS